MVEKVVYCSSAEAATTLQPSEQTEDTDGVRGHRNLLNQSCEFHIKSLWSAALFFDSD